MTCLEDDLVDRRVGNGTLSRFRVGKNTKGDSGNKGKQWDADLRRWTQIRVIVF